MLWRLKLASLQCPCLGLTSNELRVLLFSCIKGAIRESFSISPPKGKKPSRHVLSAHTAALLLHSVSQGTHGTLRSRQRKGWGSGSRGDCRSEAEAAEAAPEGCSEPVLNHSLLPPSLPAFFCLINLLLHPKQLFSFCYSITLGLAPIFISFQNDCTWKSCKKIKK